MIRIFTPLLTILLLAFSYQSQATLIPCGKALIKIKRLLKPKVAKPSRTQKSYLDEIKILISEHVNWVRETGLTPVEREQVIERDGQFLWKNIAAYNTWIAKNKRSRSGRALMTFIQDWAHQELIVNLNEVRDQFIALEIVENRNVHEDFNNLIQKIEEVVAIDYKSSPPGISEPFEENLMHGMEKNVELLRDFLKDNTPYDIRRLIAAGRRQLKSPEEIAKFDSIIKKYFQIIILPISAIHEWQTLTNNGYNFFKPGEEDNVSVFHLLDGLYTFSDFYNIRFQLNDETQAKQTMLRGIHKSIVKQILTEVAQNMSDKLRNASIPDFLSISFQVEIDPSNEIAWIQGKTKSKLNPFPFEVFGSDHMIGTTTKNKENPNSVRKNGRGIGIWKAQFLAQMNGMKFEVYWSPQNEGEVISRLGIPILMNER